MIKKIELLLSNTDCMELTADKISLFEINGINVLKEEIPESISDLKNTKIGKEFSKKKDEEDFQTLNAEFWKTTYHLYQMRIVEFENTNDQVDDETKELMKQQIFCEVVEKIVKEMRKQ